jgi:GTPase SAR1 family protein
MQTVLEAKALANSLNCRYYETSARARHNIDEVFYNLVREIRKKNTPSRTGQSLNLSAKANSSETISFTIADPSTSITERLDTKKSCSIF